LLVFRCVLPSHFGANFSEIENEEKRFDAIAAQRATIMTKPTGVNAAGGLRDGRAY
jgi:hypothetical protein